MAERKRTPEGEALSGAVLDLFRVVSLLQTAGDRLVAHLGLTSARWNVLGAIVAAERPQPVAWLARDMGANRQNVQRIINDLHAEGLVSFEENPHHRRAQLVVLTAKGQKTYDEAMRLWAPWGDDVANGVSPKEIESFHRVLVTLRQRLERSNGLPRATPSTTTSPATRRRASVSREWNLAPTPPTSPRKESHR